MAAAIPSPKHRIHALSGVARALVYAGKLNAKTAEELFRKPAGPSAPASSPVDRRRAPFRRRTWPTRCPTRSALPLLDLDAIDAVSACRRTSRRQDRAGSTRSWCSASATTALSSAAPTRPTSKRPSASSSPPRWARLGHRRARQARARSSRPRRPAPSETMDSIVGDDFEFDVTDDVTTKPDEEVAQRSRGRAGRRASCRRC